MQNGFDNAPLLVAVFYGCGARKQLHAEVVVPRPCIIAVELTDKTECKETEGGKLRCAPLTLTKKTDCEVLSVKR